MPIKLPFTEKFLWNLFNFIDNPKGVLNFFMTDRPYGIRNPEEMTWAEIKLFKNNWEYEYKNRKKNFSKLIYTLKQGGYIKTLKIKDESAIILTPKGLEKIFIIKIKLAEKKRRTDKKWQMALFDIPEKKRRQRDLFRKNLRYLGYKKLQRSIWVCPYDALQDTKDLIKKYKLEPYVELLLVKKIGLG